MKPFRMRRLEYVKSEPVETEHGLHYHVTLKEPEDAPPIGWLEKFMGRDFGIGANVGAVGALIATTIGGPALIGTSALIGIGMIAGGAVIGGVSDYIRNSNELIHGVDLNAPSYFNREAILNGLGMSTNFGIVASVGLMAAAAVVTGGAAVVAPFAAIVSYSLMGIGLLYGAVTGAQEGHDRMEAEYVAAERKYHDPNYKVSLLSKRETQWDELVLNEAAVAATVVQTLSGLAQTESSASLTAHANAPRTSLQAGESHHHTPPAAQLVPQHSLCN
jgi:hypothetical protein